MSHWGLTNDILRATEANRLLAMMYGKRAALPIFSGPAYSSTLLRHAAPSSYRFSI